MTKFQFMLLYVCDRPLEWIWFESNAFNRFRGTDWLPELCQSCDRVEIDEAVAQDGSLLIGDNMNGVIYRISSAQ